MFVNLMSDRQILNSETSMRPIALHYSRSAIFLGNVKREDADNGNVRDSPFIRVFWRVRAILTLSGHDQRTEKS